MRRLAALAFVALLGGTAEASGTAGSACALPHVSAGYAERVDRALRSGRDVWGNALLRSAAGPTYDGVRRYLNPLLLAGQARQRPLTASGFHYVAFGQPDGPFGAGSVALHLADGSQIVSDRIGGPTLSVDVGHERYGSCLARLATPRLFGGYLPILETSYVDADGTRYEQESFAARPAGTRSLTSFVRLNVGPGGRIRLMSTSGAALVGGRTLYAAWDGGAPRAIDRAAYERARTSVIRFWRRRLEEGTTFVVPERRVVDAERNLLIQNLIMGWRYSIGNAYEEFSYPESLDVAQVMGDYGFRRVERATLTKSLAMKPERYPNWQMGEKLLGSARYFGLFRDSDFLEASTPVLRDYVLALGKKLEPAGILAREQYSSDITDRVYGLHSQAVVWQGLRAMGDVWAGTEHAEPARLARTLAARLERGLRDAVNRSARSLSDGSLFLPARLLEGIPPYRAVTASRDGSYWNLVIPYALASGFFTPGSPESAGTLRYMLRHGSRLLGLVRAGAFALYGKRPAYPVSGTDNVYGINAARFLADVDEPDQLALSLYGALAAGMTPGTFVSGEAASVTPLADAYFRSMYLPPNSASNAAFLETLRLMLIHETADGLELAYATPRAWMAPGKEIVVRGAPTAFGPVSLAIASDQGSVRANLTLPDRARVVRLRLRLPRPNRISAVTLDGRPYARFDPGAETIDLSGHEGTHDLTVRYGRGTTS